VKPIRSQQLGVGSVKVSAREKLLVNRALDNNRLSYGPMSIEFERRFAKVHSCRFAVLMNSGTSALQVALHALKEERGWRDGDEVLVPAVTFVATVNVVLQNGLRPVLVDVDPDYFGMNPSLVASHINDRTRAIIPVHLCGQPCDIESIVDIARRHKLAVIEDSCETMFATYKSKPVGSWGDVACFSTYAAHVIVTGVGGLALTNDANLAVLIKSLANHGRDAIYVSMDDDQVDDTRALFDIVDRRFRFVRIGYSYRATELEAALGLGQLARSKQLVRRRQQVAGQLSRRLSKHRARLQLPKVRPGAEHVFMMYPIVVADGVDRDLLVKHLESWRIETRYLLPLTNQPAYESIFGRKVDAENPVAARLNRQAFYIGCHPEMTRADVSYVGAAFDEYFSTHQT
jgi:perosamine synthetase